MENKTIITEKARMVDIYVQQYDDRVLNGVIYHEAFPENGIRFNSTMELLLEINALMDKINYPEQFSVYRTFGEAEPIKLEANREAMLEQRATFHIRMLFRQNTSWQGELIWSENGKRCMFRSVMELLILIDSALTCKKETNEE